MLIIHPGHPKGPPAVGLPTSEKRIYTLILRSENCLFMGHPAAIKGLFIIYDCLQNTEIEQNPLIKWELLSLRRTVCVSETEKFKYQFATCFVSGGLFKLAHAHEAEISQGCIIAPRFLSRLLWTEEQSPSWHPRCPLVNEMNMHWGHSSSLWGLCSTLGWMSPPWRLSMTVDFTTPPLMGAIAGRKYLPSASGELAIKDQYNHHRQGFITSDASVSRVNKYTAS